MNIGFQVRVPGVIDVPEDCLQCGQLFSFIFQEKVFFSGFANFKHSTKVKNLVKLYSW